MLTAENYSRGLLIDDELMGGVSQDPRRPGEFIAFVLRHTSGEYLGYQACPTLDEALGLINRIPRPWTYEKVGACGGGNCGSGRCGTSSCGKSVAAQAGPSCGC